MTILIIIYGLIIGSFLNVCIYRIPKQESIVLPRSHCLNCNSSLKYYDLIPVFSFFLNKGKCRYCSIEISRQYPLIESINAFMYIIVFHKFGLSLNFLFYSIIFSILIVVTLIDLKHMIIPDGLIITILVVTIIHKALLYAIYKTSPGLIDSSLGLILSSTFFVLIIIISKGGMGGGDLKLIGSLGFILGTINVFLTIFISFILGSIISIFLLVTKIKDIKDPIPFGPFIVIAFIVTIFWGQELIDLYMNLLFI